MTLTKPPEFPRSTNIHKAADASHKTPKKAVIYCRVSSQAQLRKGDGLGSQETRCREFADYRGHEVVKVFREEGVTGGLIDRPEMSAMLKWLRNRKKSKDDYVVIIDDISRLARDILAHIELRSALKAAGVELESPSIEFSDDPNGKMIELIFAVFSQHQRETNLQQTRNRMRARVQNGYWVFHAPAGYLYEQTQGRGRVLVPDEPTASRICEALEGYASGRFETAAEVKRFLETFADFPRNKKHGITFEAIQRLLTQQLYAGIVEVPRWNLGPIEGQHEPLVSKATWAKVQERLSGKQATAPVRKDASEDFPLRGFVACACCNEPMSAAWAKGRTKRYAYYSCFTKGCPERRKSIAKDKLEASFEALLKSLRPSRSLFDCARAMWQDFYDARAAKLEDHTKTIVKDLKKVGKQIDAFLDRILTTDSPTVISAYEVRIHDLEHERLVLTEKSRMKHEPQHSFEGSFRTAMNFIANPWKLWALLRKSADWRAPPYPGRSYPTGCVTGMPRAVNPLRTTTRTCSSAT